MNDPLTIKSNGQEQFLYHSSILVQFSTIINFLSLTGLSFIDQKPHGLCMSQFLPSDYFLRLLSTSYVIWAVFNFLVSFFCSSLTFTTLKSLSLELTCSTRLDTIEHHGNQCPRDPKCLLYSLKSHQLHFLYLQRIHYTGKLSYWFTFSKTCCSNSPIFIWLTLIYCEICTQWY